jgi:fluoride exporter
MAKLFIIGIGGFVGSVLRYLVSGYAQAIFRNMLFPIGTAMVNMMGCFVIGLLSHLAETRGLFTDHTRAFLFVGVLGGFTTFSAFSNESFNLFRGGQAVLALLNIFGQVVICLLAVWFGRASAWWLWR